MKKIVIILAALLLLAGCDSYKAWGGSEWEYMSLDEAMSKAQDLYDLENLRKQAISKKDRAIIDQKMDEYRQRWADAYERQIRRKREKQEEQERLEREQAERERIKFETKRKELIQNSNGTLRDKSAQQVKKLVDRWKEGSWGWQWQDWAKERSKFFSAEIFYKVFGKPIKKQLLSEKQVKQYYDGSVGYIDVDYYYFLYGCKDGTVRIKVNANKLDDNGIVIIEDLNIF